MGPGAFVGYRGALDSNKRTSIHPVCILLPKRGNASGVREQDQKRGTFLPVTK